MVHCVDDFFLLFVEEVCRLGRGGERRASGGGGIPAIPLRLNAAWFYLDHLGALLEKKPPGLFGPVSGPSSKRSRLVLFGHLVGRSALCFRVLALFFVTGRLLKAFPKRQLSLCCLGSTMVVAFAGEETVVRLHLLLVYDICVLFRQQDRFGRA